MKWLELSDNQPQFQTKFDLPGMKSLDDACRTVLLPSIAPSLHEGMSGCLKRRSQAAVRQPVLFACSLSIGIVRSQTVQSMKRLSQTWNTSCTYVHLTMRGDLKFPV